jgi:hypothetical protein
MHEQQFIVGHIGKSGIKLTHTPSTNSLVVVDGGGASNNSAVLSVAFGDGPSTAMSITVQKTDLHGHFNNELERKESIFSTTTKVKS